MFQDQLKETRADKNYDHEEILRDFTEGTLLRVLEFFRVLWDFNKNAIKMYSFMAKI